MLSEPQARQEEHTGGSIVAATSREIVRLYARLLGRGPTRARTHLRDDHAICILEDVFTRAESTLIDGGRAAQVIEIRHSLHQEMAPQLIAIVEEQTGRGVRACLGQIDVDGDLAIEFFSLGPRVVTVDG